MNSERLVTTSTYVIDSGVPEQDFLLTQQEVEELACANLVFSVPGREEHPQDNSLSVDFGVDLFWISPEVTFTFALKSLTLLGVSAHVGRGRIMTTVERIDDRPATGELWRVSVDLSSLTGPPIRPADFVPPSRHGVWRDGKAVVDTRSRPDGAVIEIDLALRP